MPNDLGERIRRCAIYTRRSINEGPEREFNSLETQRSICSSYIASQRHKDWMELAKHYDDGGRSGATLDRPALSELMSDIEQGLIDVVVVYKLDRITRTLLDFVRLVDFFESYDVVFVSITQNFDTADSLGRLILNILLTFAQFEREICSDRIRDRIALKKKAGRWTGGPAPIGYDLIRARLQVNPEEAERVRLIFRLFLEKQNYTEVFKECRKLGICGHRWKTKQGRMVGGRPISEGQVFHILGNPIYVGEIRHRGDCYPGIHQPIIEREVWERALVVREERRRARIFPILPNLLTGLICDSYGRPMCVSNRISTTRRGIRYYVSNMSPWAKRQRLRRMRANADELEQLVVTAIAGFMSNRELVRAMLMQLGQFGPSLDRLSSKAAAAGARLARMRKERQKRALKALVVRIDLSRENVKIALRSYEVCQFLGWDGIGIFRGNEDFWRPNEQTEVIDVPAAAVRFQRRFELPILARKYDADATPVPRLVNLIGQARRAQSLVDGRRDAEVKDLAASMGLCPSTFARILRLNYLAPDIQTSILDGTQPAGLHRRELIRADLPLDWALQRKMFGFPDQPEYQQGEQRY